MILDLTDKFGSIQQLTLYFNKPTDLLMWKAVNRQRREATPLACIKECIKTCIKMN